ncbi:glycoside hydrolase family 3 C-terminal domain-containing protein [Novosphingobium sp. BL-52-GroH]|uniref:glycoside hydrolase family 3 C-terminal domain-containing protein n=1 Tax=Novosphingobium sp. BL-52-GroH TaxID=3349877 RepID=UPI00384AD971
MHCTGTMDGFGRACAVAAVLFASPMEARADGQDGVPAQAVTTAAPWLDRTLDADRRAAVMVAAMTRAEKLQLVHGERSTVPPYAPPAGSNGGAGFVPGIARLGLPALNLADSSVGVARGAARSRYSTLMPSTIAEAASWDPEIARDYGALIGRELRAQGYNASLSGGINLVREPRNGRLFEYRSEDPVLSGIMAGQFLRGLQAQNVIGDLKHFAFNDQETGRQVGDVQLGRTDARESDLLAFEIAVRDGDPGMVMCAYNKFETHWACENDYLLNQVLKRDWGFQGFVLSDWGGAHSTAAAALAGLDQEQPGGRFFAQSLDRAIESGEIPEARLDDMARRIVRTMIASGVVDNPPKPMVVDVAAGLDTAQRVAEAGMVLLKNDGVLPLAGSPGSISLSILLVGSHANVGVLTGGGSGQVDPPGGNAVKGDEDIVDLGVAGSFSRSPVWYPSSPLAALRAALPRAAIGYDDGTDPVRAAAAARSADVVIAFVNQPAMEGSDAATLALPAGQDALVATLAEANRHTVVVLETGGPVTMPWISSVSAVVEAWYPGARGGEALARLLTGQINFAGKLPVTFPRSEADLPNPVVPGSTLQSLPVRTADGKPLTFGGKPVTTLPPFAITYPEKSDVGYRWFERTGRQPLFAFGHGLSYTRFRFADLRIEPTRATFTLRNVGDRAGTEIAQIYATVPGRRTARLAGWARVELAPGEARTIVAPFEPLAMATFDPKAGRWVRAKGRYRIVVAGSSRDGALAGSIRIRERNFVGAKTGPAPAPSLSATTSPTNEATARADGAKVLAIPSAPKTGKALELLP